MLTQDKLNIRVVNLRRLLTVLQAMPHTDAVESAKQYFIGQLAMLEAVLEIQKVSITLHFVLHGFLKHTAGDLKTLVEIERQLGKDGIDLYE